MSARNRQTSEKNSKVAKDSEKSVDEDVDYEEPEEDVDAEEDVEDVEDVDVDVEDVDVDVDDGSILYTDPQGLFDPRDIAKKEISENKCPLSVTRHVSPTAIEVWEVNEMIKPLA